MSAPVDEKVIGRFAPSPTGPLHLGSLVAAVGSYLFARAAGGHWLVRMEDLDTPRVVPGSASEILSTLERFGLTWDGEVMQQSNRTRAYTAALDSLRRKNLTFDCACSRAEIRQAASAPAARDPVDPAGIIYPGTCRNGLPEGREARATRFIAPDEVIRFEDMILGFVEENVAKETGDFVVRRADGLHAYQLAVVVDDIAQRVNQVVRGGDLLSSTARQIAIIKALGAEPPLYAHLPLVNDSSGEKLSKRNASLPLATLDERAVSKALQQALRILGCFIEVDTPDRMLEEATRTFDSNRIPRKDVSIHDVTARQA